MNSLVLPFYREQLLYVLLEVCQYLLGNTLPGDKQNSLAGQLVGNLLQVSEGHFGVERGFAIIELRSLRPSSDADLFMSRN